MRFRRRPKRPPPGEYPRSATRAFMRQTLPTASPAEARGVVERMRQKGWTEEDIAELILPYMPPDPPPTAGDDLRAAEVPSISVPPQVSTAWLDQHLPGMDRRQIRLVVEELERRGWPPAEAAVAVLPHLLPKLPREDADAILTGLKKLGMSDDEIARLGVGGAR